MKQILMRKHWFYLFFLLFGMSCSEIRLIGAYDDKIDNGIQSIIKQVSVLNVTIEKNIEDTTDFSFKVFENNYTDIKAEIRALKVRADGLPKYGIIKKQLNELDTAITLLEKDHKTGFCTCTKIEDIKAAMNPDFVAINTALSAMLKLQEGLKRTKVDKPKKENN